MPVLALPLVLQALVPTIALPRRWDRKMETHHPITLGKEMTEGAGGHKDPASVQEDDLQHRQEFAGQEIVSSVNERRQREGSEGSRSLPSTQPSHVQS